MSLASVLNLAAVVEETRRAGDDAIVVCAGVQGTLALDDAYVAGRIVDALGWTGPTQPRRRPGSPRHGRGGGSVSRFEERPQPARERARAQPDIPFCARESVLDVVPRLVELRDGAAQISR